jgi:hypothetical protein
MLFLKKKYILASNKSFAVIFCQPFPSDGPSAQVSGDLISRCEQSYLKINSDETLSDESSSKE